MFRFDKDKVSHKQRLCRLIFHEIRNAFLRVGKIFLCKFFRLNGYFSKNNVYFCTPKRIRQSYV